MRRRRLVVAWAMAVVVSVLPDRAAALTCFSPDLRSAAFGADAVFEATVAARRPLLLIRALEWVGVRVSPLADRFELALEDVEPLRGPAPATIRTGYSFLQPGARYLFVARKPRLGFLRVGPCVGGVIDASEAAEVKAWLATLGRPATGGQMLER